MKYRADDGEVFDTAEECQAHEARIMARERIRKDLLDVYVRHYKPDDGGAEEASAKKWDATVSRAVTTAMIWIDADMKANPWRYEQDRTAPRNPEDDEEYDEAAVRAITGAA